tara:strand:- start:267 stop:653 length:387 start_codon:yes stop_codon:yes gene_type:complete
MQDEEEHFFNDLLIFLDLFNKKIRFYNLEIYRLQKEIEAQKTRLRLYTRINKRTVTNIENNNILLTEQSEQISKINKLICKICYENTCQIILEPCLHFCCCYDCLSRISDNKCPICRSTFTTFLKTFN